MYSLVVFPMQAIDFLDKLLRYDHQDRVTAKEAMVIISLAIPTIFLLVKSDFEDLHFFAILSFGNNNKFVCILIQVNFLWLNIYQTYPKWTK